MEDLFRIVSAVSARFEPGNAGLAVEMATGAGHSGTNGPDWNSRRNQPACRQCAVCDDANCVSTTDLDGVEILPRFGR